MGGEERARIDAQGGATSSPQKSWLRKVSDSLYDSLRLSPKMGTWLLAVGRKGASVLGGYGTHPTDFLFGAKGADGERRGGAFRAAPAAFFGTAAVAQGFLRAASPDLFDTFTNSIQLLAAQLGGTLIPTFVKLSAKIQGWADDVGGWSAETKKSVGDLVEVALWATGAAAALKVLSGIVPLVTGSLRLAVGAFQLAGTAVGKLGLVGTTAAAGLVALGVAAWQLYRIHRDEEKRVSDAKNSATTLEDVQRDAFLSPILGGKGSKDQKIARLKDVADQQEELAAQARKSREHLWHRAGGWLAALIGVGDEEKGSLLQTEARSSKRAKMARDAINSLTTGKPLGSDAERASTAQSLLMNIRTQRTEPKFVGVEDFWKNLQMEVLSKDPLEQKLEQIQRDYLQQIIDNQKELLGLTEKGNQNVTDLRR